MAVVLAQVGLAQVALAMKMMTLLWLLSWAPIFIPHFVDPIRPFLLGHAAKSCIHVLDPLSPLLERVFVPTTLLATLSPTPGGWEDNR